MIMKSILKEALKIPNKKFILKTVTVMSPYPSPFFFEQLKRMKPKEVHLVTDSGTSEQMLSQIKKKLKTKLKTIRFAECEGIFHAKAYLFIYYNQSTNRTKKILLWGSCNASEGGFKKNGEIYSWVNLGNIPITKSKKSIIKYFENICTLDHVKTINIQLNKGISLRLPEVKIVEQDHNSTFDLWLQKGFFCHAFPSRNYFRHFKINLRKEISNSNQLYKVLEENGLNVNQQMTISYDYLRNNPLPNLPIKVEDEIEHEDDEYSQKWKSKYFIDTTYGIWTSKECFLVKGHSFHKQDKPNREQELNFIANSKKEDQKQWVNAFLSVLQEISSSIDKPSQYFHTKVGSNGKNTKKIDNAYYKEKILKKQLKRDLFHANDDWFKACYINSYEFPEVPPLRNFEKNWDEFVNSFCDALYFEIKRKGSGNLLAKKIRSLIADEHLYDSEDLLIFLRINWPRIRNSIIEFHN